MRLTRRVFVDTGRPVDEGSHVAPPSVDFITVGVSKFVSALQVLVVRIHHSRRSHVVAYRVFESDGSRMTSVTSPYPGDEEPGVELITGVHGPFCPFVEWRSPLFVATSRSCGSVVLTRMR